MTGTARIRKIALPEPVKAKVSKIQRVTYLGVPAQVWQVRTAGANDLRVEAVKWMDKAVGQPVEYDAGTVVLRLVSGPRRDVVEHVRRVMVVGPDGRGFGQETLNAAAVKLLESASTKTK